MLRSPAENLLGLADVENEIGIRQGVVFAHDRRETDQVQCARGVAQECCGYLDDARPGIRVIDQALHHLSNAGNSSGIGTEIEALAAGRRMGGGQQARVRDVPRAGGLDPVAPRAEKKDGAPAADPLVDHDEQAGHLGTEEAHRPKPGDVDPPASGFTTELFCCDFRVPVIAEWLLGMIFIARHPLGQAVNPGTRDMDQLADVLTLDDVEHRCDSTEVSIEDLLLAPALELGLHALCGRQVIDDIDALGRPGDGRFVASIAREKPGLWHWSPAPGCGHQIEGADLLTAFGESLYQTRAQQAGATCDETRRGGPPLGESSELAFGHGFIHVDVAVEDLNLTDILFCAGFEADSSIPRPRNPSALRSSPVVCYPAVLELTMPTTTTTRRTAEPPLPKPPWIRVRLRSRPDPEASRTREIVRRNQLHTVCEEAACPNLGECWAKRHTTVMILGDVCTRACAFCNVKTGRPNRVDPDEPRHLAKATAELGLRHIVITSVDRDDLSDGGASQFVESIAALRETSPDSTIEVLTPDFRNKEGAIEAVARARPDVYNHNLETVPRLYRRIRPGASYRHSLDLLARVKRLDPIIFTKSGIMLGLGEELDEVEQVMDDMREARVDFVTIGQYLRPSPRHTPVERYWTLEEFAALGRTAHEKGFLMVSCSPMTRSSYHADEDFAALRVSSRAARSSCSPALPPRET